MLFLVVAVVLFGLLHVAPAVLPVKAKAALMLGKAYGPVYGVASMILLAGAIYAYRQMTSDFLYEAPPWGRYANFVLSLFGFVCLGIFLFRGSWRKVLQYPMALGVVLWATGHLLANGDVRSAIFFGGLLLFAVLHVVLSKANGRDASSDVRKGHNLLSVIAGIALYGIMTQLHYAITGMQLIQLQ